MYETSYKPEPKKPTLEVVPFKSTIKVNVSDNVVNQIKFLCSNISQVEWSGIVFYTVKGSIKDFEKLSEMVITLEDIFLMDKGTGGATEFEYTEEIVAKMSGNPDDYIMGHIHSHNNMGVFFSGTDWSELNDNCTNHNYYLSVIVNNKLDIIGKIAFTGTPQHYISKDENGEDYSFVIDNDEIKPRMFVYNCDISLAGEMIVSPEFKQRLIEIETKEEKKEAERKKNYQQNTHHSTHYTPPPTQQKMLGNGNTDGKRDKKGTNNHSYDRHFIENQRNADKNGITNGKHYIKDDNRFDATKKGWPDNDEIDPKMNTVTEAMDKEDNDKFVEDRKMSIAEEFGCIILRLGADLDDDHIDTAMWEIEEASLDPQTYADAVLANYEEYHEAFFKAIPKRNDIVGTTEELITLFEDNVIIEGYDYLEPLANGLKKFLLNMVAKEDKELATKKE